MNTILTILGKLFVMLIVVFHVSSAQWIIQTSGVTTDLNNVCFLNESVGYAVGSNGVILKTMNGGSTWTAQSSGVTKNLTDVSFISENNGLVVGYDGTILSTVNGGTTWEKIPVLSFYTSYSFSGIHMIGDSLAYVTCGDIYGSGKIMRTLDRGASFDHGNTTTYLRGVFAHDDMNVVAAGGGTVSGSTGVLRKTTDGGFSWTGPSLASINRPNCVYFVDTSLGFIGGYNGTMNKTTDGGQTWSVVNTGTTAPISAIWFESPLVGYATGGNWLYTTKGFFVTTDGGTTWNKETLPMEFKLYGMAGVNASSLFVVGEAGKILKRTGPTGIKDQQSATPSTFSLKQNFPNPFNPSTTVHFSLHASGEVSLKVFNLLGMEVADLASGHYGPGNYSVQFDGSSLPSGMYLARLQHEGNVTSRSMMLLK